MKPFAAFAALAVTLASATLPAFAARDSYVIDNAHMLSATATQRINQKVGDFTTQTGKEVVVDTEPSLNGATLANAAEKSFAANQVNGVLIYIAKGDKQFEVVGDRASRQFFPSGSFQTIHDAMRSAFNQGNIDDGVNTGVDLVLNQYRSHEGSLNRARSNRSTVPAGATTRSDYSSGGFHMSWIWWLIALAVIFFVIRGIFRAIAGPRMYPPGYGGGGPMMGGPGYGPGYGGGYGGGGGGFWSGMLGGLGGAFLGNELFGNRGGWGGGGGDVNAGFGGVDSSAQQDASGWQSDAGQADMGNAGGGGWGDSGGGWGGGDSGGGGGDGGGGW